MARYTDVEDALQQRLYGGNSQHNQQNRNKANREGLFIQGTKIGERVHRRRIPLIRIPVFKIATSIPTNSILVSQNRKGTKTRIVGKNFLGIGFNPLNLKRWFGKLYILDLSEKIMNVDMKEDGPAATNEVFDVVGNASVSFKIMYNDPSDQNTQSNQNNQSNQNTQADIMKKINNMLKETEVSEQVGTRVKALVKDIISDMGWDSLRRRPGLAVNPFFLPQGSYARCAAEEIRDMYGIEIGKVTINKLTPVNKALRDIEENMQIAQSNIEINEKQAESTRNIERLNTQMYTDRANAILSALYSLGYSRAQAISYLNRVSTPNNAVIIEGTSYDNNAVMMALNMLSNQFGLFSQQGFPQQGFPQPGYPQPGYPQQGFPQQGFPQQGYPQQYDQSGNPIPMPNQQYQQYQQNPDPNQQQHTR